MTLTITVHGQPKPKGSMRHVGKGRMVEQLDGSPPWREAVKHAARGVVRFMAPLDGPLAIDLIVTVRKPPSAPKRRRWPATQSSGDIDKHLRNVLDALDDAGVMTDDSRFVEARVRKCFPGEGDDALPTPGGVIRVWQIEEAA